MLSAADIAVTARPPLVTVRSGVVGELDAVRATVSRVAPRAVYSVRFRVRGGVAASLGCVASASARVRAGSGSRLVVALRPRGEWCAGAGVLSVAAVRRGAAVGAVRLAVRPALALGRGDLVGRLSLGPTCPVERASDPCDPVARPAPVTLVARNTSGDEAARTTTLADGSFALSLTPGSYTLHVESTGAALPRIPDAGVVVTAQATRSQPQRVVLRGDTGIR
jgi:hypothetical protein